MKRVLFVSYYFPPSGGSGVQRPLKFIKFLRSCGWDATVLTVNPEFASYSDLDESMADEIPEGVKIIRTRARDPYAIYSKFTGRKKSDAVGVGFTDLGDIGIREKLARWVRGNVFIPDARVGWTKFAVRAAEKELAQTHYDAMITTGPPHSSHLIGSRIKKKTGLPWIIDLRDAWPSDSYGHLIPMSGLASGWDSRLRGLAFQAADRIISVSKSIIRSTSKHTRTELELIPNGFDEDDFKHVVPIQHQGFSIVFTGHMPDEQNPDPLWKVIHEETANGNWPELHVYLVGNVSRATLESIQDYGLEERVTLVSYVAHKEAIKWTCGADLLLLTINRVPNPDGIITGKLYEYLASAKPVLCVGPPNGDAAEVIASCSAGFTVDHHDNVAMKNVVGRFYDAWEAGTPIPGASEQASSQYSRRNQAASLANILDQISS